MKEHWVVGWGWRSVANAASFASCWAQAHRSNERIGAAAAKLTCVVLQSRMSTSAWQDCLTWQSAALPHAQWLQCTEDDIHLSETPSRSERLLERFGTGSVCEALALHAARQLAGVHGTVALALPRIVSADRCVTLAAALIVPSREFLKSGVES